jgi:hypothetical protein
VCMVEDQCEAGEDDKTYDGDVSDSTYLEETKCAWWKTSLARLERTMKHMMVMLVTPRTWRRRSVHGGRLVWRGWRGQ